MTPFHNISCPFVSWLLPASSEVISNKSKVVSKEA